MNFKLFIYVLEWERSVVVIIVAKKGFWRAAKVEGQWLDRVGEVVKVQFNPYLLELSIYFDSYFKKLK